MKISKMLRKIMVPIFDVGLICFSYLVSYLIRFDFNVNEFYPYVYGLGYKVFLSVLGIHVFFYFLMSINKIEWMKTSLNEFLRVISMNFYATVFIVIFRLSGLLVGHSLAVIIIMSLLNVLLMFSARVFYRNILMVIKREERRKDAKHILIYGAGSAGRMILVEILENPNYHYHVVGFIDDNKNLHRTRIYGTPVLGGKEFLERYLIKNDIDEIIVAMPSVSHATRQNVLNSLTKYKIETKVVSSSFHLIQSSDFRRVLRPINVLDLLGRSEIVIDDTQIRRTLSGKTVMITGAGGSIGTELTRQILTRDPERLILVDVNETGLYAIQQEILMKVKHGQVAPVELEVLVKSIRDYEGLESVFEKTKPEIIFHAAAHKHVPLMETVPEEAIKNNILGTYNLIKLSDKYKVEKFVNISTDKAVNPTNVMGATKRYNEMMLQAFNKKSDSRFVAVRFGNVLGSNGSVVPLFQHQIASGGPVTVTHPEITRYFMTIPEAVSLILQSAVYAQGGEIFVLDMGEPVKILDMAKKAIELSGLRPYKDIQIEYIGLRPGEKLYEELLMSEEGMDKTANELIYIAKPMDITMEQIEQGILLLKKALEVKEFDHKALLKQLVPTYKTEDY